VPIVTDISQLDDLAKLQRPLIVGLTINPEQLAHIRRTRQRMLGLEQGDSNLFGGDYADLERIRGELVLARRLFARHKWPELDVTKRSVEETAAAIYQMVQARQQPELKALAAVLPRPGWSGNGP
jgi:[pyruvate, water dikinase]-phosphate phosphotransferase / [pyruvate, water dikinase] kinase